MTITVVVLVYVFFAGVVLGILLRDLHTILTKSGGYFRIKPRLAEPRYLYVLENHKIIFVSDSINVDGKYIGKIKLETEYD